jgi:mannosyltransferase
MANPGRGAKNRMLKIIAQFPGRNLKRIGFLLLAGFALYLRLHHLDYESLWMDELLQVSFYPHSFFRLISDAAIQSQPPLDYWIGRLVYLLSGSDFAVRLPAALFGTGAVVLLAVLIARLTSWPVGLGCGVLAALMPFNLYYAQEARPYAIAVFMLLWVLLALDQQLTAGGQRRFVRSLVLLLSATAFLHTRALWPLVITVSLLLILVMRLLVLFKREGAALSAQKHRIFYAAGALLLAIGFYIPSLRMVLAQSGAYVADQSIGLDLAKFLAVIINCNLRPIWQSFFVQSDPLTYPALLLVCLSPWFILRPVKEQKWATARLTLCLLPLASLLHLFIFQAKSNFPFRPPYAGYILPRVLVLGGISFHGLWTRVAGTRYVHAVRYGLLATALIFFLQTGYAAQGYKSMPRKTEWRQATAHLEKFYGAQHLIIFDSLSLVGNWEPTLFGFRRYYQGRSPLETMARLPLLAPKMRQMNLEPLVVLFQWREYFLTPQSIYPIMSTPQSKLKLIDYESLTRDPVLSCRQFTGFTIIRLKHPTGNLVRDSYTLIERLILNLPAGSWLVELHLAVAGLARVLHLKNWEDHLAAAVKLTDEKKLSRVAKSARWIRRMPLD